MNTRTITATVALLATILVGSLRAAEREVGPLLGSGTVLSARPKRTLGALVDELRRKHRLDVSLLDKFGRKSSALRKLELGFGATKEPFWELMTRVREATRLKIKSVDAKSGLALTDADFWDKNATLGKPAVAGAFLVDGVYESFFKRPEVRFWSEPWLTAYTVRQFRAQVTLPDDTTLLVDDGKTIHDLGPNGAVVVPLRRLEIGDAAVAKTIQVSAVVAVPTPGGVVQSKPLVEYLPDVARVDDFDLRVVEFRNVATEKGERLRLRVEADGMTFADGDVKLLDAAGKEVESSFSSSGGRDRHTVVLECAPRADLAGHSLELGVSELTGVDLGKLDAIQGKDTPAGRGTIRLTRFFRGGSRAVLNIESRGATIPGDEISLVAPGGERIVQDRNISRTRGGVQTLQVDFPVERVRGDFGSHRLRIVAAGKTTARRVDKIARRVPTLFQAGAASVRILGLEDARDLVDRSPVQRLRLEVEGVRIEPEQVSLLDRRGRSLRHGAATTSNARVQEVTLSYDPRALKKAGGSRRLRLRVEAPAGALEHPIRATLRDVPLRAP